MNIVQNAEFKVGDTVTYRPYFEEHKMKVVNVTRGMGFDNEDQRIFYHLSISNIRPVTSVTTGESIMESSMFMPIEHINEGS